jgi:hypothetical protein
MELFSQIRELRESSLSGKFNGSLLAIYFCHGQRYPLDSSKSVEIGVLVSEP